MLLSDVLHAKGGSVVTVAPDTRVRALLEVLAEHGIGAAIVSADGRSVDGIVSERDVVRALAARGSDVLEESVQAICTTQVQTATPGTRINELMRTMTERRIRHVPVLDDGQALLGIVSIGDIVKRHIDELEVEKEALSSYITAG